MSFKRILVGLALTDRIDGPVLRYAGMLASKIGCEKIYFEHVAPSLDLPDSEPVDESIRRQMGALLDRFFKAEKKVDVETDVTAGSAVVELARRSRQKKIDLILVGRKAEGSVFPGRIARKASCSVLVVPEGGIPAVTKIVAPIDFSDCSAAALNTAVDWARSFGVKNVHCLHAYAVPLGYYKSGMKHEEFAKVVKRNAEESYQDFMKKVEHKGVDVLPTFVLDDKPARALADWANREKADLVVMGARGKTRAAWLLIGNVAEKVIQRVPIPVLAVRPKGKVGFLDAMMEA